MRRWIAVADECARLRCPELAGDPVSSVAAALASRDGNPGVAPAILLEALAEVVERRAGQGDGPGAATVLDGVGLVFDLCCPVPLAEGRYPFERQETIALWHRLRAATDPLPRCQPDDACPRCWEGQPCGRDELVRRIAPGAGNWRWHNGKLETGYSITFDRFPVG